MSAKKHQLAEVLCGIWFEPNSNPWDSTYFGKYYDKLEKQLGFTEKQEQKAFRIKVELKSNKTSEGNSLPEMTEGEPRMVFKNNINTTAVVLSSNFISFHKLPEYESWDSLIDSLVKPGIKIYSEIGLGKDVVQVQCLYLNKYSLDIKDKLSDYFSFIPSIEDFGIGSETNLSFQSQYDLSPNMHMLIKLNGNINPQTNTKEVFFECSCFAKRLGDEDIFILAKQAHDQTNLVYKKITK